MAWKGKWDDTKTVFTGSYEFPDGNVFIGEARWVEKHVLVHMNADGFSKTVESPIEPHFEFTGTWEHDGHGGSPVVPPIPK